MAVKIQPFSSLFVDCMIKTSCVLVWALVDPTAYYHCYGNKPYLALLTILAVGLTPRLRTAHHLACLAMSVFVSMKHISHQLRAGIEAIYRHVKTNAAVYVDWAAVQVCYVAVACLSLVVVMGAFVLGGSAVGLEG